MESRWFGLGATVSSYTSFPESDAPACASADIVWLVCDESFSPLNFPTVANLLQNLRPEQSVFCYFVPNGPFLRRSGTVLNRVNRAFARSEDVRIQLIEAAGVLGSEVIAKTVILESGIGVNLEDFRVEASRDLLRRKHFVGLFDRPLELADCLILNIGANALQDDPASVFTIAGRLKASGMPVKLLTTMQQFRAGYADLEGLANLNGLVRGVDWNSVSPMQYDLDGYPAQRNLMFNAADIVLWTGLGERTGQAVLEAAVTGAVVVVPDHSGFASAFDVMLKGGEIGQVIKLPLSSSPLVWPSGTSAVRHQVEVNEGVRRISATWSQRFRGSEGVRRHVVSRKFRDAVSWQRIADYWFLEFESARRSAGAAAVPCLQ